MSERELVDIWGLMIAPRLATATPLLDLERYNDRMNRIRTFVSFMRESLGDGSWRLRRYELAVLMAMPVDALLCATDGLLRYSIESIPKLVRYYIESRQPLKPDDDDDSDDCTDDEYDEYYSSSPTIGKLPRSYDNRPSYELYKVRSKTHCAATLSPLSEACHFLPPRWTSTADDQVASSHHLGACLLSIESLAGCGSSAALLARVLKNAGGQLEDEGWNRIVLKTSLAKAWRDGALAIEHYDWEDLWGGDVDADGNVEVKLVLRWLGDLVEGADPADYVDLEDEEGGGKAEMGSGGKGPLLKDIRCAPAHEECRCEVNMCSCDAFIFGVKVAAEDAADFVHAVKLQWGLLRIAGFCGAATSPEKLPGFEGI